MKLAGYGVAQIVVRRLAVRQAHVRISVWHPRGALYSAEAIRVSIIVKQILSMLWIQIRVGNADPGNQEHGNLPKLKNKPGFLPFKRSFVSS